MRVGLTGGIGCGKSTALRFFAEEGAHVVETDALAKSLLDTDPQIREALVQRFGGELLNAAGKIDRARLASTVFPDSEALAYLESLVHPRVREVWMQELSRPETIVVVEIPLLFEKDLQSHFDRTVCVSCDEALQLDRLQSRGMNPTQIDNRKKRQLSLEEKMRRADIILFNNGSLDHLRDQVRLCMSRFTR